MHEIKWRLLSRSCMSHASSWYFSASASLQHCEVIVSVSASLELLFCPHLRPPPPPVSQGHEDGWVTPTKEPFKPPVCNMPVSLSVCLLYVSLLACLSQCLLCPCLLVLQPVCLQVFLSVCLFMCLPSSCSANYLSPCLLTCLPACQWIHMLLLVLSQQLDSIIHNNLTRRLHTLFCHAILPPEHALTCISAQAYEH